MVKMARVDDYFNAKKIAVETLSQVPVEKISKRSGFTMDEDGRLIVPFLNRVFLLTYPGFDFTDRDEKEKEVPIQEQVLILHYMMAEPEQPSSGRWIAYREIPGASFYFSAFVKRAIDPLKKVFGSNLPGFIHAAERLNGKRISTGDAAFEFRVLPNILLQLVLYTGDDEFPPEANILFNDAVSKLLLPEDAAWLAGMLVYRLAALAR